MTQFLRRTWQATLLLHEALYLMAAKLGQKDSSQVRQLVQILLYPAERGMDEMVDFSLVLRRHGFGGYLAIANPEGSETVSQ